eukprot:298918-Pyramimonas_sp.AAC.2
MSARSPLQCAIAAEGPRSATASSISALMTTMNRSGLRVHPWEIPEFWRRVADWRPMSSTKKFRPIMMLRSSSLYITGMPKRSRADIMPSTPTLSKAFLQSNASKDTAPFFWAQASSMRRRAT